MRLALTTNADNIVGTNQNDTINGYILTDSGAPTGTGTTFQVIDTIDGKGGVNSLNLTVQGAGLTTPGFPAANVTNVQKFNIRDLQTGAAAYDFATFAGETHAVLQNSTNVDSGGVTFSNLGTGTTVGLAGAQGSGASSTKTTLNFSYATPTDAVNLELNGAVAKGAGGAPVITAATTTAATTATISTVAGSAASVVGAVTLSGTTGTLTTLNVVAGSDLTAALTSNDFSTTATTVTLNVAGAGAVSLGNGFTGKVINAAANSGGLTITSASGTKTFVGGTGKDVLTLGAALAATGTVDLGAGNDLLLGGSSTYVASTNNVDGGVGVDAVSAKLINAGNGAVFKNFEQVDLAGATGTVLNTNLLTGSTIQNVLVSGAIGGVATLTNLAAGVDLLVTGNSATLGTANLALANSAGSSDSFAINFANTSKTEGASTLAEVVLTGVETINVASGGVNVDTTNAVTKFTTSDNSLTKLVIVGANDFTIGSIETNRVSSAPSADIASALTLVDGSSATGDLNISAGLTNYAVGASGKEVTYTGLTINTGAGNDQVTNYAKSGVVSSGDGNDIVTSQSLLQQINVGAGNDIVVAASGSFGGTLISAAAIGFTTAKIGSTITGLGAGDKIDVNALSTAVRSEGITNFTTTALTYSTLDAAVNAFIVGGTTDVGFINWTDGKTYLMADNVVATTAGTPPVTTYTGSYEVIALVGTYTNFGTATSGAGVITLA